MLPNRAMNHISCTIQVLFNSKVFTQTISMTEYIWQDKYLNSLIGIHPNFMKIMLRTWSLFSKGCLLLPAFFLGKITILWLKWEQLFVEISLTILKKSCVKLLNFATVLVKYKLLNVRSCFLLYYVRIFRCHHMFCVMLSFWSKLNTWLKFCHEGIWREI